MPVIETEKLSKSFSRNEVVSSISLKVEKGEIFGFLGRNGAGKTTFVNMLTGITLPTSGRMLLLNNNNDIDQIKHRVGVLPDYSTFYDHLSAKDHLKYFCKVSGKPAATSKIEEVLRAVGLIGHEKKKVGKFSFGMKKKLGIAQALIHDPELLFLDEPTSGVDAESAIHIQRLILELQKNGKTIFMTSHNLDEVERICTRIAIMKEGHIHSTGTMKELKKKYQTRSRVQIKLSSHIKKEQKENIKNLLFSYSIEWKDSMLLVDVMAEEEIPTIVHALSKEGIDIFAVHVHEPSLQEIFLRQ
ncbi:ABC transporter ATP-binding protein [Halobacillus campisalis]|uniref:ATP-binding cassette domain-containing protein n=1 Tax=Halobacillus campisalis TaxID=435909 RepID=A0ABW2K8J6_9BACI|nr:ABC transporter ATP-binding protein [Halobacillus campisalis]